MSARHASASQAPHGYQRPSPLRRRPRADYAGYNVNKAIWVASHPDASPAEYEAAIRAIAKSCGV